jgi:hypothetical protein
MATKGLDHDERNLLRAVVSKHRPALLPLLDRVGLVPLTDDEREDLRGAVACELVETGITANAEPNEMGLLLERLIDLLGHQ